MDSVTTQALGAYQDSALSPAVSTVTSSPSAPFHALTTSIRTLRRGALPGGDEAQRFILRHRDRAHRLELTQGADEREIARCDVGHDEQTDPAGAVGRGERIRRGGRRAAA